MQRLIVVSVFFTIKVVKNTINPFDSKYFPMLYSLIVGYSKSKYLLAGLPDGSLIGY